MSPSTCAAPIPWSPNSDEEEDDGKGVRLYQSIYETALRNQVPRPVIDDLIRIYSYDVDFQRKVQPGDSFEILFAGEDENAGDNGKAEVLFASLTTGGETRKFYRYQTTDDNVVDYYDESGKSAKKFLVRKPLADGIVRSGFGSRNHPILGYTKMHTGVDWAASMGTPIFASGNGTIDKVGWEGGYGKYIRIRHANGYETAYGHMSAFARGMEPGKKVRQGQVIGYVGSTGLSTGAHLHYEILINGRFVDPMKIKLPRGRVLDGTAARRLRAGANPARHHDDARARLALCARQMQIGRGRRRQHGSADASRRCSGRFVVRAGPLSAYAAAASLPLKVSPCLPAEITTLSPSLTRPDRIISASGSCTDFWITRLSGRAP